MLSSAMLVLKVAGEIAALTPASVVGKIISASADMAMAVEDALYIVYNRVRLESAWALTKKALDNPHYRRLNLAVRALNPTLAKYSIAYGAIEVKDPIAISAMNKIGLSNETLEQPDAKVNQVVAFLEALYDEDIEVKRQYTRDTGWVSNAPTIEDYALRTYLTIRALASKPVQLHHLIQTTGDLQDIQRGASFSRQTPGDGPTISSSLIERSIRLAHLKPINQMENPF